MTKRPLWLAALALVACNGGEVDVQGIPSLGNGTHSAGEVAFTRIATEDDGLNVPRDLEFNPDRPGQLWIVNRGDDSTTIIEDAGFRDQSSKHEAGANHRHFMANPAALAFSDNGNFATAQEEDERTQGNLTPPDFMGPTLWTSNLDLFDSGIIGHIDMLHNSPNSVGIAWQQDNEFWVYDGYHEAISHYDFNNDHGPGGSDHSDGEMYRYVQREVTYTEEVPSHLDFGPEMELLYIADTGASRIAVLDTTTGTMGNPIMPNYDSGATQRMMLDADIWTLVEGDALVLADGSAAPIDLVQPSGLEVVGDTLYVSDHETSRILAFDLDGVLIDWLDTGLPAGTLMGIEVDDSGEIWVVDALENEVQRISPK